MFRVGATYTIKMLNDDGETTALHGCKIIRIGPSLVEYQQDGQKAVILNTASRLFIDATLELQAPPLQHKPVKVSKGRRGAGRRV
jgi:hypothetical protein